MPNSNVWSEWNKASHTKRLRNDDQKRVCVIKLGMNLSKMPANEFSALRDSMSLAAGFAVEAMRPLDTVVTMSPMRKGWTWRGVTKEDLACDVRGWTMKTTAPNADATAPRAIIERSCSANRKSCGNSKENAVRNEEILWD